MIRRSVALLGLVAAFALSGCASDDWQGRYNEATSQVLDMAAERDAARGQVADTMADLEAERARNAQLDRDLGEAIANEQAAIRRAQELEDALTSAKSTPAPAQTTALADEQVTRLEQPRQIDDRSV